MFRCKREWKRNHLLNCSQQQVWDCVTPSTRKHPNRSRFSIKRDINLLYKRYNLMSRIAFWWGAGNSKPIRAFSIEAIILQRFRFELSAVTGALWLSAQGHLVHFLSFVCLFSRRQNDIQVWNCLHAPDASPDIPIVAPARWFSCYHFEIRFRYTSTSSCLSFLEPLCFFTQRCQLNTPLTRDETSLPQIQRVFFSLTCSRDVSEDGTETEWIYECCS